MLDLPKIDLSGLASALEDHSDELEWYIDSKTGEILPRSHDIDEEIAEDLERRDLVYIDAVPSDESYQDLVDFSARVRDPRARDLLVRAIEGRGAFRRFKDTLLDLPDLRKAWFAFHDIRMERRAIEWLMTRELVEKTQAEQALTQIEEPELPEISGALDAQEIVSVVATDLKKLYGNRLKKVILFGSWARGDAHPESDIDLLLVLDRVDSWSEERNRIDDILWRHSLANSTIVSSLIVSEEDFVRRAEPVLRRVSEEGVKIA